MMEHLKISPKDLEHVEAYAEYRNIVGDTDDGALLSEQEYERLRQKAAEAQKDPLLVYWRNTDGLDCRVVGPSSSCVCGHRYRDHDWMATATKNVKCRMKRCSCPLFTYIPVHGSRDIKCRCKHSYLDHDPSSKMCRKCGSHPTGRGLPIGSGSTGRYHALSSGGGLATVAPEESKGNATVQSQKDKSSRACSSKTGKTGQGPPNAQEVHTASFSTTTGQAPAGRLSESSASGSITPTTNKVTHLSTCINTGRRSGASRGATRNSVNNSRRMETTSGSNYCSHFSPPYTCSCGKNYGAHETVFETASERGEPPPRLAMQTLAPTGGLAGMTSLLDGVDRLWLSQRHGPSLESSAPQFLPAGFTSSAALTSAVAPAALSVCEEETSLQDRGTVPTTKTGSSAKRPTE